MKISAAVVREPGEAFSIETLELRAPREDEVLIRVAAVGLCHTDIAMMSGRLIGLPAVLGHEGAGVVERIGSRVTKVKPGDRVGITFLSCGTCARCDQGEPAYCHMTMPLNFGGRRLDGTTAITSADEPISSHFFGQSSFASHCLAFERNIVPLAPDVPFAVAAPFGCGVQTGAGSILRSLDCRPGSSLLVLGGGAVGLSAVMAAKLRGCGQIIVLEPHEARRTLALELGATHVLDPAQTPDLAAAVRGFAANGVDYAFDTTGIPPLLNAAVDCLAPRGVFGIVGIAPPGTPVPGVLARLVSTGLTIRGILEGDSDPDSFIPELIEHYRAGHFPVDRLVTTYPFAEINRAVADQHSGKCVKVVLTMSEVDA